MAIQKATLALIVEISFAAAGLFGQSTGSADTSMSTAPQFAPVGVAPSETLQVNLANIATASGSGAPLPQCGGTLAFYGAGGEAIGNTVSFSVAASILSVPLPYSAISTSGERTVVRVAITLSPVTFSTSSGSQSAACRMVSSLETYDTATGVTHVFIAGNPGPLMAARSAPVTIP